MLQCEKLKKKNQLLKKYTKRIFNINLLTKISIYNARNIFSENSKESL